MEDYTTLTNTLKAFITAFSKGYENLLPHIEVLLGSLLVIELVLMGLFLALSGGANTAGLFKKLLFISFWLWIVSHFPALAQTVVDSFIKAGFIAGGGDKSTSLIYDPSRIVDYGLVGADVLLQRLESITF